LAVLGASSSVATADLNGDGRPEVIFGDTKGTYGQIVFLNTPRDRTGRRVTLDKEK